MINFGFTLFSMFISNVSLYNKTLSHLLFIHSNNKREFLLFVKNIIWYKKKGGGEEQLLF